MRRSKDLFKQFIKLFKEIDGEGIAEKTKVDEFSKKLKMREHLLIMLWYVIGDCITRVKLSDSLKGILSERYKLIEISKSQLSKVNKKRDYRAFVWAFYELIDRIWRDRRGDKDPYFSPIGTIDDSSHRYDYTWRCTRFARIR